MFFFSNLPDNKLLFNDTQNTFVVFKIDTTNTYNDLIEVDDFINLDNAYIHLYGKDQIKKERKMGHVNILQHKIENDFLDDDDGSDDCDAKKDEYWDESLLNSLIK